MRSHNQPYRRASVNMHKNARLTPAGRALLVERVLVEGQKVWEVSAFMGVSERTGWKWIRRFREEGPRGLRDRSSRPRHSPRRTPAWRVKQIEHLRRRRWTSPWIARRLGIPLSTVGVVLRRLGLNRLSRLDPKPRVIRYERKRPGELVHLDTKKLARIVRIGHRIHGDRSKSVEGVGWEFLHVCIDDCTRVVYQEVLPDEKGETATGFLKRAAAWFKALGVSVERVMTDNGSCYRSKVFGRAVRELGARHLRTRPYTPRTNGKAERYIQTATREWAYVRAYPHSSVRRRALKRYTRFYNAERPHTALGYRPPLSRLLDRV